MSAIRHGREQLPPDVAAQQRRLAQNPPRRRCGWCSFVGTQDETDAHEDTEHAYELRALLIPNDVPSTVWESDGASLGAGQ